MIANNQDPPTTTIESLLQTTVTPQYNLARDKVFSINEIAYHALEKFPWVGRLVWFSDSDRRKDKKTREAQWKLLIVAFRQREQLVARYEKTRRLTATASAGSGLHHCRLRRLQGQLNDLEQLDEQGQHISFPYPPLQELELNGHIEAPKMFDSVFRFLSALTRLTIRPYTDIVINMKTLLTACPLLEVLLLSHTTLSPDGDSWLSDQLECRPALRLLQLDLLWTYLHQSRLQERLSFTPRLCDLKLQRLCKYAARGSGIGVRYFSLDQNSSGIPWDNSGLLVLKVWKEWNVDIWSFLNTINYHTNVVTSLELGNWEPVTLPWESGLAKFLASSPQLLHLRAPQFAIPLGNLSVDRSVLPVTREQATRTPPVIWACRGLLTLRIGFHGGGQGDIFQENCTRVMFGYIARVCPLLRDLQIDSWESPRLSRPIYLRLKSGFCLLSKLKHLESLRIGPLLHTATFLRDDLDWMVPAGHTKERKENRYPVEDVWELELRSEMLEEEE
ncbi:hypothetical protein BGX24_011267 [Mortierella sp. AD032]|nr:hypothetical protein BGX24_011267 [Mortierella sp. AD032]